VRLQRTGTRHRQEHGVQVLGDSNISFHRTLRFTRIYQPFDVREEMCVEKIVVYSWRLRRLLRAESGHIARALPHGRQLAKAESEHSDQTGSTDLEPYLATDHLFVPSNGDLDKNLRYEVMINKQLNHAIAQLERLQAMRKAESVPG
jgi:hypothetical protein